MDEVCPSEAYTFTFVVDFLDATRDRARADAQLQVLADLVPRDGRIVVIEGVEGEELHPLTIEAVWEWRGAVTIEALRTLRAYGRL